MNVRRGLFSFFIMKINSQMKLQLFFTHVIIVILVLALANGMLYFVVVNTIMEKTRQSMEQLSNQIVVNLNNSISGLERITFLVNYEEDLNALINTINYNPNAYFSRFSSKEYKSLDNYFFNMIYSLPEIYGVYIYTKDGVNILARNKELREHSTNKVNKEWWFQEAIKKRGVKTLIGRHKNVFANETADVISVVRALTDFSNNNILGVVVVDREVSQLEKTINDIRIGKNGAVIVLDKQNNFVYSNNDSVYKGIAANPEFHKNIDIEGYHSYSCGNGTGRLLVTQNSAQNTGWKVLVAQPYAEIFREIIRFEQLLVILLILCLVMTFAISAYTAGKMSAKLRKMESAIGEVVEGNFNVRVNVGGNNEITRLAYGFNSMLDKIKQLIEVEFNEKLLRKEAELKMLQAQISPHFLFNTLGSIKCVAEEEGAEKTAKMVQNLANLFRYNMGKISRIVTVSEEIEHAGYYLQLQQYRFENRVKVTIETTPDALTEKIPSMTLQPILENAFVHGFEKKRGKYSLVIKCFCEENHTKVQIIDDGIGVSKEKAEQIDALLVEEDANVNGIVERKIGIYNVNTRIKYCFGDEYGLKLLRNPQNGVTVELLLPKENKSEAENAKSFDC